MFDFKRATVFCLRYRLSKPKMSRYSKYLGWDMASLPPPPVTPMHQRRRKTQVRCVPLESTPEGFERIFEKRNINLCLTLFMAVSKRLFIYGIVQAFQILSGKNLIC